MFFIKMNSTATTTTTSIKPIMMNNDESNKNKNDFNNLLQLFKIFSETGTIKQISTKKINQRVIF
jgi:hypothetical protein